MKAIFTLISVLFFSVVAMAGRDQARLSVTSLTQRPVRVLIDGRQVNEYNGVIRIDDLRPGRHRIEIYNSMRRDRNDNWGMGNNQGQAIYNSYINLRPGTYTDIIVSRSGRVFVDELGYDDYYQNGGWNNGNNNGGWNNGSWNNGNNNNGGWNNGGGNGNNWLQAMDNNSFQQLKRSVQNESFDNNKLEMLKNALTRNAVSSSQVRELMQLMSFENNKLELAKYAYRYTVDRNNYFIVSDAFSFSNSRSELNKYIAGYND